MILQTESKMKSKQRKVRQNAYRPSAESKEEPEAMGVSLLPPSLTVLSSNSSVQRQKKTDSKDVLSSKSFDELYILLSEHQSSKWSSPEIPNKENPEVIAALLVKKMNSFQARKYGIELYSFLEGENPKAARKALIKFQDAWKHADASTSKEELTWGDQRNPESLLTEAEHAYMENNLANCTRLLKSAIFISEYQYQKTLHKRKEQYASEKSMKEAGLDIGALDSSQNEIEEIKNNVCKIYSFYDWKALFESRLPSSEKLPYLRSESDKVQEALRMKELHGGCSDGDSRPDPVRVPDPDRTPDPDKKPDDKPTNVPRPKSPQKTAPEHEGERPKVIKKDSKGITFKVNLVLPKTKIAGPKTLGKYLEMDSLELGGEIEVQITLFPSKDSSDAKSLATIEIDGEKKSVVIKKEMEQLLWASAKSKGPNFTIKAKEGGALKPGSKSGEVAVGLEADFWGGGSFDVGFKLIDIDNGQPNFGVATAKLAVAPIGILKLLGVDVNKKVDAKARKLFGGKVGVTANPKVFLEGKFSPNVSEILKELGKKGVEWAIKASAEGAMSGLGAITIAELATLGIGVGGMVSILATMYLSYSDNALIVKVVKNAEDACSDYRAGFVSSFLGFPTQATSEQAAFFKDGQRVGASHLISQIQKQKAIKDTAEYKYAQEGHTDEEIMQFWKEAIQKKIGNVGRAKEAVSSLTSLAEYQIKKLHMQAWKKSLEWRGKLEDSGHEEHIIRIQLFKKFNAHGKRIR